MTRKEILIEAYHHLPPVQVLFELICGRVSVESDTEWNEPQVVARLLNESWLNRPHEFYLALMADCSSLPQAHERVARQSKRLK